MTMEDNRMDLKIVKNIYEKMADQKSRQIFVNRLLYSITEHPFYLQNVIKASTRGNAFITKIEKASGALVLFGAGIWGREIYQAFPDAGWKFWTDSCPQKEVLYHMPVVPFAEFMQSYSGESVVVTSRLYHQQMVKQLLDADVPPEKVINAGQLLDRFLLEQYFDLTALPHAEGKEIFVDAGSFDGMSSVGFKQWAKDPLFVYALAGAKQLIKKYRPKLAISIYHKPEDILEVPEIILSYHPGYQLYMRHYSLAAFDTVLYAVPGS